MKNLTLIFTFLFIGWSVSASENSKLATTTNFYNYNDSFIFVEGGVEFAVYPNGEFDFYFNPDFRRGSSVHISSPNVNISYNSGYNYEPFIQYDDYGAVIQIEDVPVYYDYYGRIIQAGNIYMRYNNFGRLARVGNLHVHYNHHHHITHYSGYISPYNRRYVYRPWHDYYRRPNVNVSIVFGRPYRAYYEPQRISYNKYVTVYNNYYANGKRKRNFYRPSQSVRNYNYGRKTSSKRNIAQVKSRSSYNVADARNNNVRTRSYSSRDNGKLDNVRNSSRSNSRGNVSDSKSRVYSDRNERSTNSRGRTSRMESSSQKRQVTARDRSVRSPQQRNSKIESRSSSRVERAGSPTKRSSVQTRSSSRVERSSSPASRTRSIEKSSRSSERNSSASRPTSRQSSSSVRTRTNSGTSRSQAIRSKNSSRSRSSARNVDNRI